MNQGLARQLATAIYKVRIQSTEATVQWAYWRQKSDRERYLAGQARQAGKFDVETDHLDKAKEYDEKAKEFMYLPKHKEVGQ